MNAFEMMDAMSSLINPSPSSVNNLLASGAHIMFRISIAGNERMMDHFVADGLLVSCDFDVSHFDSVKRRVRRVTIFSDEAFEKLWLKLRPDCTVLYDEHAILPSLEMISAVPIDVIKTNLEDGKIITLGYED